MEPIREMTMGAGACLPFLGVLIAGTVTAIIAFFRRPSHDGPCFDQCPNMGACNGCDWEEK